MDQLSTKVLRRPDLLQHKNQILKIKANLNKTKATQKVYIQEHPEEKPEVSWYVRCGLCLPRCIVYHLSWYYLLKKAIHRLFLELSDSEHACCSPRYGDQLSRARRNISSCPVTSYRCTETRFVTLKSQNKKLGLKQLENNTEKCYDVVRHFEINILKKHLLEYEFEVNDLEHPPVCLDDLDVSWVPLAVGCNGVVFKATLKINREVSCTPDEDAKKGDTVDTGLGKTDVAEKDLAMKLIFNYVNDLSCKSFNVEDMLPELVPLHMERLPKCLESQTVCRRLPYHPNIVDMVAAFEDTIPITEAGLNHFPAALPCEFDPHMCFGGEKTLYAVSKLRPTTLKDYLIQDTDDISMETRCVLFAQLLEGVAYLGKHRVAHRDIKTDNILLDIPSDEGFPRLEICDFGSCLAKNNESMKEQSSGSESRGGNTFLMAPEVASAMPGDILDYTKEDIWAAGTIAYEIFGSENPFYRSKYDNNIRLDSASYSENDLPSLGGNVPEALRMLIQSMLAKNPARRPTSRLAALVSQVVTLQYFHDKEMPSPNVKEEIYRWLVEEASNLLHKLTNSSELNGVLDLVKFCLLTKLKPDDIQPILDFAFTS